MREYQKYEFCKTVKWLYSKVWKRWLWNDFYQCYDTVLEVKGWRTARIESKGGARQISSPCFKLFWIEFK